MIDKAAAAVGITATGFRDDRSAELVTITDMSFDGCHIGSHSRPVSDCASICADKGGSRRKWNGGRATKRD